MHKEIIVGKDCDCPFGKSKFGIPGHCTLTIKFIQCNGKYREQGNPPHNCPLKSNHVVVKLRDYE